VDQADGQPHGQFAAAGLGQQPALHPGVQEVELCLLCRPRRYADQGGYPVGGDGVQPTPVGIIYTLLT
ncbi:MAG TPA: hypothetical protein VIV12_00345, partial [Streptosporangiaceae bacterium]